MQSLEDLSIWRLIWRRFRHHKIGFISLIILAFLYIVAAFAGFFAPHSPNHRYSMYVSAPPQRIHFFDETGRFHVLPFVYGWKVSYDPMTFKRIYVEDRTAKYPVRLFVKGDPYLLFGVLPTDVHLFGTGSGKPLFLLGTDRLGRDVLSRIVYGARISLTIGLVGELVMTTLGALLGIVSGYFGGLLDTLIQRVIEVIAALPSIPLWIALAASVPQNWSPTTEFFVLTLIIGLLRWVYLARQVRGKVLVIRDLEFVQAAQALGANSRRIIVRHVFPNVLNHVLVIATLSIPSMILAEAALSFLGLGIKPPSISWGSLLQAAQNVRMLLNQPWLLLPGVPIIITVVCFNFVGDALRDALDPFTV